MDREPPEIDPDIENILRRRDGERVRAARMSLGWSKERAARFAGISSITWKRIEDGLPVRDGNLGAAMDAIGLAAVRPQDPAKPTDLAALIATDPTLSDAARAHFLNQYRILQQYSATDLSGDAEEQRIIDSDFPEDQKKRMLAQLRRTRERPAAPKDHGKAL